MTDLSLRARERDAAALDSPEARAAVLVERLRAGTLDPERLALAAFCGDAAALTAFGCRHDDLLDGDRGCVCHYGKGGGHADFRR